jgi:hypothetical protein
MGPSGTGPVKTPLSAEARHGKARQGKTRPVAMDRFAGMRWDTILKVDEELACCVINYSCMSQEYE